MNGQLALVGDSILDNGAYTDGRPDVVTHLRGMLPAGWRATLLAVEGSLVGDLEGQLALVCTEPADYANTIEPSVRGGEKIARAITRSFGLAGPTGDPSRIYF